jgi:hypothetical protein
MAALPRGLRDLPRPQAYPSALMNTKIALQVAVVIGSIVPIAAGAAGIFLGPSLVGGPADSADLDGHFRYLSGLLLGIGLAYLSAVPRIEQRRQRFLLLGAIVFIGGLGRLLSVVTIGTPPSLPMIGALMMELAVTPLLTLWQFKASATGR